MLKAGAKRKKDKPAIVAEFFNDPVTAKIAADLLTLSDSDLVLFFRRGYETIQLIGSEVTKSAIGMGDPEALIKKAGENAPEAVKKLGLKIEGLAESIENG